jgi:transcription antitermination protein NusB
MKSARRRARELALQGIYQWQLSHDPATTIAAQLRDAKGYDRADEVMFEKLLAGVIADAARLEAVISPYLDRRIDELSPVERGILLLGAFELTDFPETPYRVVLNEAIELAKSFGGTDGHKYVNGVLDKIAARLRPHEASAQR